MEQAKTKHKHAKQIAVKSIHMVLLVALIVVVSTVVFLSVKITSMARMAQMIKTVRMASASPTPKSIRMAN